MHSSHYYSSYKIQSAPPLAGHLSDLTIAEKYYLARIYSQCGEQKFTIDACVGMFGLSRHQTTVYLEGFCERGITKRHRNDMNRSYSYFLLITPDSHPECFSTAEIKSKKRQRTYPSVGVHTINCKDAYMDAKEDIFSTAILTGNTNSRSQKSRKRFTKATERYLNAVMNGKTSIPLKSWKAERDKLNGEKKELTRQYYALKDEVKEVEQIRRNVYRILREENGIEQPIREYEFDR